MTWVIHHPQIQEITSTDAGHKFSFGTNSGFNNSKTNSASPSLVHPLAHGSTQPETFPAPGDLTSTKGFHSNAKLLYLLMVVVDILGLEHTLTESFIKIKRIREALSNHSTNISSVNAAHSYLAFSTTLLHVFWIYQHQLCINSTSTCNFLKDKRVKAYLNPWWHTQSLNPNFKLQETHSQCKILGKSIQKLCQPSWALWKNKWKNPSSLLILLLPCNKALRRRLTGLFDMTEVLPNWDAQVLQ